MAHDLYVDNNKTIYASKDLQISALAVGTTQHLHLGLSEFTELPGQSTIFVNKINFSLTGFQPQGGTTDYVLGHFICGIVPTDLLTSNTFKDYSDFQDFKAWPIKGSKKYFGNTSGHGSVTDTPQNLRMSFTYSPKSSLLLNRDQSIIMTIRNDYGDEIYGVAAIDLIARRGD